MDVQHSGRDVPQREPDGQAEGEVQSSWRRTLDELFGAEREREAAMDELSPWYGDVVEDEGASEPAADEEPASDVPASPRTGPHRGKRLVKPSSQVDRLFSAEQRVLILDIWIRSGLAAGDFAPLVRVSKHTLYAWKKRFEDEGPAGLVDKPRGSKKGSKLPEATKRAILMLKEGNPEFGVQRISDLLLRGPALAASPGAVARVLHEAGYVCEDVHTTRHEPKVTRFERENPNDLWQTDIFTFVLKRTNRRVHLVAFMDDHSRFIVSFGLHATASSAMVIETFERGIASYRPPVEVLTDNGPQYVTWRGTSAFAKVCERRGIKQIVARPRHPQTLGKIERFWGTLWREFLQAAVFVDINDAERRIGLFVDYANFQRPHQGIGGLAPAERYFQAQSEVLETLKSRVAANALEIARNGLPKTPFFLTGNVGGKAFSVHAAGERLLLRREGEDEPREIDLTAPKADLPEAELVECEGDEVSPGAEVIEFDDVPAAAEPFPCDEDEPDDFEDDDEDGDEDDGPRDAGSPPEDDPIPPVATDRVKQIVASLMGDE